MCLLIAAGASIALGACGSSHKQTSVHGSAGTAISPVAAKTGAGTSSACKSAKQPRPRGPEHLSAPSLRLDPAKAYVVRLMTNCGEIDIDVDVKQAPRVTASFVHLVNIGFYNDLTFHRIVSGFVIQGGDPNGDGSGGPGYTVTERPSANVQYTRGTVAMAKAASDPAGTAGSQFFIVTGRDVDLPPQYAVLGHIVGGERTIAAIDKVPTTAGPSGEDSTPVNPVVIYRASVKDD